ncbi:MAG: hypothetical protein OXN17_12515 [Candidatus Poribacteria bacterium]|nr:hypothetical protein [Candidatus Poribacteria bacterium]MDE0503021.1 hypothetical protein [Candidatus Poribacteria bacterium]
MQSKSKNGLSGGAAEAIVTPVIEGEEAYDDLYVRVLVLADGMRQLAIVTTDFLIFHRPYMDVLLDAIDKATGIPKENILINPSQTHNGCWPDPHFHEPGDAWENRIDMSAIDDTDVSYETWLADCDLELGPYSRWLAGSIVDVANRAVQNLRPVELRAAREPAQIGYNRRVMRDGQIVMEPNFNGAVVPWVDVLGVYGRDGRRVSVLFLHAAHPVIIHESSSKIGPDFPGYTIKHLRNLLDKGNEPEGIYMFAQGCCGDINGYPLRGGFNACDVAGLSLANAVSCALAESQVVAPAALKCRSMELSLPLQDPPPADECRTLLSQQTDDEGRGRYSHLLKAAESGEPQFKPFSMRALAVGDDLCFFSFSGEMFAEYQLFTDKVSPFKHTLVFNHTNGYDGYVATKADYDLGPAGGYEALRHPSSVKPWLPPHPSCEKIIKEGVTRLLSELKSSK